MATFEQQAGELMMFRRDVEVGVGGKTANGELIVTDRRVVLLVGKPGMTWASTTFLGWLPALLLMGRGARHRATRVSHEIARADVRDVQVSDKNTVTVRNRGTGYGLVAFDVIHPAPNDLAAELHAWAGGEHPGAPLPEARLVDK